MSKSNKPPREFWINWMATESSYEDAKDSTPKAEWEDLKCYVEKSAYDQLKDQFEQQSIYLEDVIMRADQLLSEALKLMEALEIANDILRSAYSIAEREGKEVNWPPFKVRLKHILENQHEALARWEKYRSEK